jgi:DNA adenine methylase
MMPKPVLKWVGGKRQLINQFSDHFPEEYGRYLEPFFGGGAIFFHLEPTKSFLNDYNSELMIFYAVLKYYPYELIDSLDKHINDKDYYYSVREMDRTPDFKKLNIVDRASRLMYLNRTCFNGLYRVNSSGQFNAPFGKYKNPTICDKESLLLASKSLQKASLHNTDFEKFCLEIAMKGDFIYFDPPYIPLNETSSFTSYTGNDFTMYDQERLSLLCKKLDKIGCKFMLSNSYTDKTLSLYEKFEIIDVMARRNVNSDGKKRGEIKEVLVKNY